MTITKGLLTYEAEGMEGGNFHNIVIRTLTLSLRVGPT